MIWLYYDFQHGFILVLDLKNTHWIQKIHNFATNISLHQFVYHIQSNLGKSKLLKFSVLLSAQQTIQVSFQTFLTESRFAYNNINLSPVSQFNCFSSPSSTYQQITANPVRQYFSRATTILHKINPSLVWQFKDFSSPSQIYHKANPTQVMQSNIFQVQVQ